MMASTFRLCPSILVLLSPIAVEDAGCLNPNVLISYIDKRAQLIEDLKEQSMFTDRGVFESETLFGFTTTRAL